MTSRDFKTSVRGSRWAWLLPVAFAAACSGPTEPQFVQADQPQLFETRGVASRDQRFAEGPPAAVEHPVVHVRQCAQPGKTRVPRAR